jgi:uncharacterized protein (DUF2147 family)
VRNVWIAAAGFVMMSFGTAWAAPSAVDGLWRSEDGEGIVSVGPCAAAPDDKCGKLVWLKVPLDKKGQPVRDENNPDAALKVRPVCGIEILSGMKPDAKGGFGGGTIYDPEEGKSYKGSMALDGAVLKITGVIETPVLPLSGTEAWSRVAEAPVLCDAAK